jgi:hypothetical protein
MPIEYIIPIAGGDEINRILMRVSISKIIELEKLQEVRMQAVGM